MKLYNKVNNSVTLLKEKPFKLEREIKTSGLPTKFMSTYFRTRHFTQKKVYFT